MQNTVKKLGLVALVLMTSLSAGCSTPPKPESPEYTNEFLAEVAKDHKTCGPAAKEALKDWQVMVGL